MDCFLLPWNNTHNFTVLAAISSYSSMVQVPGKTDMIKTKGISCCMLSHYLCVWDLWGILSNERQYLNLNNDSEKFALSIFLRNQRSHDPLYRCSVAIVLQRLDGGVLFYMWKDFGIIRQPLSALGLCVCMHLSWRQHVPNKHLG